MKKIITALSILLLMSSFGTSHAYDRYLNGDRNWKFIYGHMGYASYMDMSSATVKLYSKSQGTVIAVNIVTGVNIDNSASQRFNTLWIYIPSPTKISGYTFARIDSRDISLPPNLGDNISYISYDNGENWRPVNLKDNHGYNLHSKNTIIMAVESVIDK